MAIDMGKLQEFMATFVTDFGATVAAGNVVIGHNLGLYRALAEAPATAGELAGKPAPGTGPAGARSPRCPRRWWLPGRR